jgi:hypothetical protein
MRRRWWILYGLAVLIVVVIWLDPTCVLWGLIRGETFYRGRPSSFWARQMQAETPRTRRERTSRRVSSWALSASFVHFSTHPVSQPCGLHPSLFTC